MVSVQKSCMKKNYYVLKIKHNHTCLSLSREDKESRLQGVASRDPFSRRECNLDKFLEALYQSQM